MARSIKALQRLGFTLDEIAELTQACDRGTGRGEVELRAGAAIKLAELERKIATLSAIRDTLRFAVDGGCDDPLGYLQSPCFELINTPGQTATARSAVAATNQAPTPAAEGHPMTTIDTEHPIAVAVAAAIHTGDLTALRQLLAEHPGLAEARLGDDNPDGMSRTLLHVVTDWPGHYPNGAATVATLVAAGADVNGRFRGPHEETALHWAASSNDVKVLDALLDAGADIDGPGAVIAGGPPLADATAFKNWAAAHRLVERGAATTLHTAAALGLLDRIEVCIAAAEPPTPDEINSAFWSACHSAQQIAAEYLLDRGADVNWLPPWGDGTPLDEAIANNAGELARWLRDHGATPATEMTR